MHLGVMASLICLCLVGFANAGPAKAAIRKDLNVPAEELGSALQTVAKDYDFQVLYRTEVVKDLRTQGAVGSLTSDEALGKVLKGTGLTYKYLDSNTVTIMPAAAGSPASAADQMPSDSSNGGGKKTSQDFRVAQVAQGAPPLITAVTGSGQTGSTGAAFSGQLEEIIVTAQKRPERLIDTPQSVTVLSSDALSKLGATQFSDFANAVPGLSFQTLGAGFTDITLRGVTTGFDVSPTVGIYVDDVPYGSATAFAQGAQVALDVGLFDLERIEVLRGPQGTLYGASTMGGLLKYVTKLPDLTSFGGEMHVGVSDTNDGGVNYNGSLVVNAPIMPDKAAVRASFYYSRDGGYIDNLAQDEKDVNRSGTYGGRLDVLIVPTDQLSIRVTGFAQNISRDGEATVDYASTGLPEYGSLDQYRKFSEPFHQEFRLVSADVSYDFGPARLTSISSYQTAQEQNIWDVSQIYVPLLNSILGTSYSAVGSTNGSSTDKFTQETRIQSKDGGPLEWVLGGFYTHESSQDKEEFLLRDAAGAPAVNNLYQLSDPSNYTEAAAFGDLTWRISSQFDVTGGLRYAHDREEYAQDGYGFPLSATVPQVGSSENTVTYLADARYHFNNHTTTYLRYATGYRPGGPNVRANDPVTGQPLGPSSFQADKLKSYEVGFKGETEDRRLGADLSVYYIDWSNIQVFVIEDGFGFRENAPGGATVQGSELTFTARPTDGFIASAAFAYQHAYLKQADADLGARQGERLPNVPRFTAALNGDYTFSQDWHPTVGATVRYITDRDASWDNNLSYPQFRLPAYASVDLRGGLTFGTVITQLFVHNLFDKRGELSDMYPQFGNRIAILQPRTVGISANVPF
jgi:iron complex outermembrane recepter protein